MKNKTLISLCVNLLVGILFSFPVFSAQNYVPTNSISKFEYRITDSELTINKEADTVDKLKRDFFKKKKSSGRDFKLSKSNTLSFHSNYYLIYLYSDLTFPFKSNLHPTFVDISYLLDLRVTKMLC